MQVQHGEAAWSCAWVIGVKILCKSKRIRMPDKIDWEMLMNWCDHRTPTQAALFELLRLRTQYRIH